MFVKHTQKDLKKYAKTLYKDGVVVVPFLTEEGSETWNENFFEALEEFPEYQKIPDKFVLGGFGALGNTSSFHHPNIRDFRFQIKEKFDKPFFKVYENYRTTKKNSKSSISKDSENPEKKEIRNVELMFDRLAIRSKIQGKPTAEAWHRDVFSEPKKMEKDDTIFGGWINLNRTEGSKRDQHFVACKKTHKNKEAENARKKGGGFSVIKKEDHEKYKKMIKDQGGPITVTPGSIIIFPQQIVHSVKAGVQPEEKSIRLFLGHRLTTSKKSLFEDIKKVTKEQGLPRIPSGQLPHLYTPSHVMFHVEKMVKPWADPKKGVFKKEILEKKTLNSSNPKKDGLIYYTPGRFMKSLEEYEMKFEEYSKKDIKVLKPEKL
jgi:hypothetical protein